MKVIDIEHETFTKEHAEHVNRILGSRRRGDPVKEGDIIYRELNLDGVVYRRMGKYKEENHQSEESVRSFFKDHAKWFKREHHWILTKDQTGDYCYYRSAKQLNTLQKQYPERFLI